MLQIAGCTGSQKTHLAYALAEDGTRSLYVLSNEERAKEVYEEYRFLDPDVYFYPARDFCFIRQTSEVFF